MKLLVVNNLRSGLGDGSIYDLIRHFSSDGDEVCIRATDGTSDLKTLVQDAQAFDAVVACGGDGTIAAISYAMRNSGVPILPFPAGTANLLALNLASPIEPHALSKLLRSGRTLDFDVGEMKVGSNRFGFSIIAGAGYDAEIMKDAKPTKRLLGPLAYVTAAISNAIPPVSHFTINLDGETIERDALGILVINFSKIQFEISVTHNNLPRDGTFDIAILKGENAFALIPALIAGLLDRGGDFPERSDAVEVFQAHEIEVHADPAMDVQFDGETTGLTTPFKARILERAARFYVSEEGYELFSDI